MKDPLRDIAAGFMLVLRSSKHSASAFPLSARVEIVTSQCPANAPLLPGAMPGVKGQSALLTMFFAGLFMAAHAFPSHGGPSDTALPLPQPLPSPPLFRSCSL
jgi:hypothetical protein